MNINAAPATAGGRASAVALSVLPLLRNPVIDDKAWRVLRLDALMAVAVTGALFVVALPPIVAWPLAWLGYTLVHEAITVWYPYPFVDAAELGYAPTLLNCITIAILMVGVGAVFLSAGRRLPPTPPAAVPASHLAVTDRG